MVALNPAFSLQNGRKVCSCSFGARFVQIHQSIWWAEFSSFFLIYCIEMELWKNSAHVMVALNPAFSLQNGRKVCSCSFGARFVQILQSIWWAEFFPLFIYLLHCLLHRNGTLEKICTLDGSIKSSLFFTEREKGVFLCIWGKILANPSKYMIGRIFPPFSSYLLHCLLHRNRT